MSADALAYALKNSPYKGSTWIIHIMLGDIANDAHGYRLWLSQASIAKKAKTTRSTVALAVQQMVSDGFLTLEEDNSACGKPNVYIFNLSENQTPPVRKSDTPLSENQTHNYKRELQENIRASDRFEEFWASYPRKVAKRAAGKAWSSALKRADAELILSGLGRFPFSSEAQFVPYPATWLNNDRWVDVPAASESRERPSERPVCDLCDGMGVLLPENTQEAIPCVCMTKP